MEFDVKRLGKEAVIVEHPLAGPQIYGVEDSFWEKSEEEQRKTAIEGYMSAIDIENSDFETVAAMQQDVPD